MYLLKKAKKDYSENIYISNLTDSNKFWKTVRPIFGSKIKSKNSMTLVEVTNIIQEEGELANTFNVSIVKNLGINENLHTSSSETRNIESIIAKFASHPSILTIRNRFDEGGICFFKEIGKTEAIKEIKNLDIKKGSLCSDIPLR